MGQNESDVYKNIREQIEWVVLREYIFLVRKGYITVKQAAERLQKNPEEVRSWVETFNTVRGFLDEGKENYEENN